jgi:hypothetical protein
MRNNSSFVVFVFTVANLVLFFSSCGKSDHKPVYPAHGQVFDKNNRPAVDALVVFHPLDNNDPKPLKPLARVDEKGNFTLSTYEKNDGGPEGEYIITIEWRRGPPKPFAANKEGEDRLSGNYSDPKTSKLRFKITSQPDNVVPPIYLK